MLHNYDLEPQTSIIPGFNGVHAVCIVVQSLFLGASFELRSANKDLKPVPMIFLYAKICQSMLLLLVLVIVVSLIIET